MNQNQCKAHQEWIAERMRINRELFGDARMEGPDDPPSGTNPPATDPPKEDPSKTEKMLPQSQVDAIAAREKAEGKRAAEQALATELGVDLATAKQIITKAREAEDAQKTDAQKAREAADAEKTAAEAEKQAAKVEVYNTRLERAFVRTGLELGDTDADKAKMARIQRMVSTEPGATFDEILADVQAIKTEFPGLFDGKTPEKTPQRRAPGSDPKGKAPAPKGGEDAMAKGRERARRHRSAYSSTVEKSS